MSPAADKVRADNALSRLCASATSFENAHEALSYLVAAIFRADGYDCAAAEAAGDSGVLVFVLPAGWNANPEMIEMAFVKEGAPRATLSCLPMGETLIVHCTTSEATEETSSQLELCIGQFVDATQLGASPVAAFRGVADLAKMIRESFFPATGGGGAAAKESGPKAGAGVSSGPSSSEKGSSSRTSDPLRDDRLPSGRPGPSPLMDLSQPHNLPGAGGRFGVGRGDLQPAGFHPSGGDGSLVGPNHPGFFSGGGVGPGPGVPDGLPRGAVPPGARFDPFGPPIPPNADFVPGQHGVPNPDIERPPRFDDMFG